MSYNINVCGKCSKFCQIVMYVYTRYCYLPLLRESWCWSECGVGIVPICDVSTVSMAN